MRKDVLTGKTKVNKSDIVNLAKVNTGETQSLSSSDEITKTIKKEKIESPQTENSRPLNISELESSIRELAMNKLDKQVCLILLKKVSALMNYL